MVGANCIERPSLTDTLGSDVGVRRPAGWPPGHCRGAMSMIVDDEIAIVGDTMVNVGPWSVFPPFADHVAQLLESWKRRLETGCRIFLPGHGTPIGRPLLERRFEERRG